MEEDIKILEERIRSIKYYDTYRYDWIETDIQLVENLIKEFKKIKIENIEYKIGQMPDTTEEYKLLKKELEEWRMTND